MIFNDRDFVNEEADSMALTVKDDGSCQTGLGHLKLGFQRRVLVSRGTW